jgi:hypothetical protein
MRLALTLSAVSLIALSACDKSKSKEAGPPPSAVMPSEPPTVGALSKVTPESLEAAAKKAGYTVKETRKTKTEMPGVALSRLSLEREGKAAFADFYDFSKVSEAEGKPIARVGTKRAVYVRVQKFDDESSESAAKVLGALFAKKNVDELSVADIKSAIEAEGWTLEGSTDEADPDVPGVRGADFTGEKSDDSLDVVVIDYGDAAAGKTSTSALNDAHRVLLVDAKDKAESPKLAAALTK